MCKLVDRRDCHVYEAIDRVKPCVVGYSCVRKSPQVRRVDLRGTRECRSVGVNRIKRAISGCAGTATYQRRPSLQEGAHHASAF